MKYTDKGVENIKIAYIGGGSRGWAWGLMSDLVSSDDISGDVALYDIDFDAAYNNEIIGNMYNSVEGAKSKWSYKAYKSIGDALTGANFVIISIQPGTFKEMESDVHTPEKYGIYQSVGDTTGPGGIIRALRAIPMFEEIALNIKKYCPDAWVINYTNPMTMCTRALYRAFPEIKAFGCCHEVFGTQKFMLKILEEIHGITDVKREDIKINVTGLNHFTWLTEARYKDINLFDSYKKFCDMYSENGYVKGQDENWMFNENVSLSGNKVKMDLFKRFGYIAAAGDRHLAEDVEGDWYLGSKENVKDWLFKLTPVSVRVDMLKERNEKSENIRNGKVKLEINNTGEEGVKQIRAILGLHEFVTNVNLPNIGQIPNLPMGAVVETNAYFGLDKVQPVCAGELPREIYPLITRLLGEQELVIEAAFERNLDKAFMAFSNNPLVTINSKDARKLFDEMIDNTKEYLKMYNV